MNNGRHSYLDTHLINIEWKRIYPNKSLGNVEAGPWKSNYLSSKVSV